MVDNLPQLVEECHYMVKLLNALYLFGGQWCLGFGPPSFPHFAQSQEIVAPFQVRFNKE
jgi:hypothetical protein